MKKKLLTNLFLLAFVFGQVLAAALPNSNSSNDVNSESGVKASTFCNPQPKYRPYTYISKIEFQEIEKTLSYNSAEQWIDLTDTQVAGLEAGGTYTLTITARNYDSGSGDPYAVRVWADWNNDGILSSSEIVGTEMINQIGAGGAEHPLTFTVNVPSDVVGPDVEFGFRAMLYYRSGNYGDDPCGEYEGGTVVDFGGVYGEGHAETDEPEEPEPVDEVCLPNFGYFSYVNIDQVKFGNMTSETLISGARPSTSFDYREDADRQVELEAGNTYNMEITVSNFDSGDQDPYVLRAYVDWNNNNVLELNASEYNYEVISQIGAAGSQTVKTFAFTVPDDAVMDEALHMRVLLHYKRGLDGEENPCDNFDSGQYQEYYVFVKAASGIKGNKADGIVVYPNPTKGSVYFNNMDMTGYSLYSIDGKLLQQGNRSVDMIDISAYAKGTYLLNIQTVNGTVVKKIVLE